MDHVNGRAPWRLLGSERTEHAGGPHDDTLGRLANTTSPTRSRRLRTEACALTQVRPFLPTDEPAVVALWTRAFADDRPWNAPAVILARKAAMRDGLFWVAELDDRIVGALIAGWDGQRGWLYHLATDPDARRRGVGRALVEMAEAELGRRGCPKVNLQILERNRDVVAFYERLGYVVEARIDMGKRLAR